jgi:hypothetical protein
MHGEEYLPQFVNFFKENLLWWIKILFYMLQY